MSNRTSKHSKKEAPPSPSAAPTPSNALEQLMLGAKEPSAFKPVSKDEILDYLDRNPNWYYLFGELIRLEKLEKENENESNPKPAAPPNQKKLMQLPRDSLDIRQCPSCKSYDDDFCFCFLETCRSCGYLGEDPIRKVTEKIIENNSNMISASLKPPQTGLLWNENENNYDYDEKSIMKNKTCWSLTQELKERLDLPSRLNAKQKNHLLPPLPKRPNPLAFISRIEVFFWEGSKSGCDDKWFAEFDPQHEYTTPFNRLCGLTFFYNDSIQIPIGYTHETPSFNTSTPSISNETATINLEEGEHIVSINPLGSSPSIGGLGRTMIGFYTTKGRWLVVEDWVTCDWKPEVVTREITREDGFNMFQYYNTRGTDKLEAPEGKAFQFFELTDYDHVRRQVKNPMTFSIQRVNDAIHHRRQVTAATTETPLPPPAVAPLYALCEKFLQDYYPKRAATTRIRAYKGLEEIEGENYEECKKISQNFAERLPTTSEVKTIRMLNHLMNFALSKMEEKRDILVKCAREAYAPAYEASKLRIQQHKKAALEEQVQIYEDHVTFQKQCEFLTGNCDIDDENTDDDATNAGVVVVGTEQQVCFLCKKVYQPKQLSFVERCQAEGCSCAFWNCGCGIKICRYYCKGIYCGDHCGHYQDSDSDSESSD